MHKAVHMYNNLLAWCPPSSCAIKHPDTNNTQASSMPKPVPRHQSMDKLMLQHNTPYTERLWESVLSGVVPALACGAVHVSATAVRPCPNFGGQPRMVCVRVRACIQLLSCAAFGKGSTAVFEGQSCKHALCFEIQPLAKNARLQVH